MAQILELQGTLVTVTLLEGDPEYLTGWAEKCLSSNNITNKLNSIYSSFTNEVLQQFINVITVLYIYSKSDYTYI